ncbi:MAG: alanine racemase [Pseudomonadales bacterium]
MPGRLIVDLDALAANYQRFRAAAPEVGAAVKADAYGLGVGPVAERLRHSGCRSFFVATAAEGVRLRQILCPAPAAGLDSRQGPLSATGCAIYVLEGPLPETLDALVAADLVPVVNHQGQLDLWRPLRSRPIAVHVDTGMARLGYSPDIQSGQFAGFDLCLLMTHLACADTPDHPQNRAQVQAFRAVAAQFPGVRTSMGNSPGWLTGEATRGDLGRPGIGLFGGNPFTDRANPMDPVVRFEGQVLQRRRLPAGSAVGYGATAVTGRITETAVLGIGYEDGVKRALAQQGAMAVGGHRVPFLGRISMDFTVVDITDCLAQGGSVEVGDWVECFGLDISVDEAAAWAGTIAFEMFTGIGNRVTRHYVGVP